MRYNLVKVPRASLTVSLQCPLCCDLIHGATTISECLHTFCRDCIYQRLDDGETEWCPICNVSLGCSPLEKLRVDHQLDDICAKIFSSKLKKRKTVDSAKVHAPSPVHRKERSLSSLGIGAVPSSGNSGHTNQNRKTKTFSRRSTTIMNSNIDEFETSKVQRSSSELRDFESGKDLPESDNSAGIDPDDYDSMAPSISGEREEMKAYVKSEILSHGKRSLNDANGSQKRKRTQIIIAKRTLLPNRGAHETPSGRISKSKYDAKLSAYLVESSSKGFLTGINQKQPCCESSEQEESSSKSQDIPRSQERNVAKKSMSKKVPKVQSSLACLAEVAVDHGGEVCLAPKRSGYSKAKTQAVRSHRNRGKASTAKNLSIREDCNLHAADGSIHASGSQHHPKVLLLKKAAATGLDKLTTPRATSHIISAPKLDRSQVGLWFALKAADDQIGENALPQIVNHHLRIKNGKLPVSVLKKYLVKKLDLENESEVEITCRGQPVISSLSLENVQRIWFATAPPDSIPSIRKAEIGSLRNEANWAPVGGSSAEDYSMVLTYGRNRRIMMSQ